MNNKYNTSLAFWTMGEKYWSLSQGVCDRITRNRNQYIKVSKRPISWNQLEQRTKGNDVNMVIPLLFNFYHGLELMLKGFVLYSESNEAKLDHKITQLYLKFKKHHSDQKELIKLFGQYLTKSQMPKLLQEFLNQNKISVNRFYESLRYPFNRNLSNEYQHFVLKYKGEEGIQFYRSLSQDIRLMMKLVVALAGSLE